jgi:hypothetical protein
MNSDTPRPWWQLSSPWIFIGFAAIAAFFLITEHRAHAFQWLPLLLLAACPLMHLFHGHGGHGGHEDHRRGERTSDADADDRGTPHRH